MPATETRRFNEYLQTLAATAVAADVRQLAHGRAGVNLEKATRSAGQSNRFTDRGQYLVPKATGVETIDGGPLWWDRAAGTATPVPLLSGRGFFLGSAAGDQAAADTTCVAALNARPAYTIDLHADGGDTDVVRTAGSPYLTQRGGTLEAGFSATAEAQKLDWVSRRTFPVDSRWVLEAVLTVKTAPDADAVRVTVGAASGSHASDPQAIANLAAFHLDPGADANVDCESDDGTTDVNPTDSTVDWAAGVPLYLVVDGRNPAAVRFLVNGVRALPLTTFTLAAAAGPLRALFHVVKTADDTPGVFQLDALRVRTSEQGA